MRALIHRIGRLARDQRGTAAIEFGVVAPVFFAMLLGIIDVGRYMWTLNTIQYAIDDGVRYGVVQQKSDSEVTDWVKKSMAGLKTSTINVDVDSSDPTLLSVSADTTYTFLFPISAFMETTTIDLSTQMPK
ncbi:TadE/TadG family type IV pilus assembly protein [Dongia deserti]|uniref:TadE/TadG family type IV pilus assembly protein n=1 Tax=Dongia deserti TaxID=2268030 RepID=UPI0013C413D8|nr:TadE/TadG family type IV pilus assembly protein [Dongia deserti]